MDTVISRFQHRAEAQGEHPLWFDYYDAAWRPTTWAQARVKVEEIAAGLMALGIERGDRVALVGVNNSDWVAADYAIQHAGALGVPLYNTLAPDQLGYVLGHSGSRILIVDGQEQLDKALAADIPGVEKIVAHHLGDADRGRVLGTDHLRELGRQWTADHIGAFRERMQSVEGDDVWSIIYTSGTTGPPKGTVLTHSNALWTADTAFARLGLSEDVEVLISYLPLSHVFERLTTTVGPIASVAKRFEHYFVPELPMVPDALKAARPTFFIGVPRVWEKFQARIRAEVAETPAIRQKIFNWATDAGIDKTRARDEGGRPKSRIGAWTARKVVGKKVCGEMGLDRCKYAVSGAAPLAPDVQRFFQGIGVPLHQGWGLTETTAACSVQGPGELHVGTVGRPLGDGQAKLAEDGELLVKGPNVFRGYYNEPEKTKEALDDDGWLATGDIAELADDGTIKIVDRKKDIIITAGGKNIAPQEIESRIKADGLVGEAIVIGEQRPYLVSLISLDPDETAAYLTHQGIEASEAELYRHPKVLEHIEGVVAAVNAAFSRAEGIRKWHLVDGGFPAEAMTPTMKLKRRVVNDKFADDIDALYT